MVTKRQNKTTTVYLLFSFRLVYFLDYLLYFFLAYKCFYTKSKQLSNTYEMFVASLTRRFVSAKRLFRDL